MDWINCSHKKQIFLDVPFASIHLICPQFVNSHRGLHITLLVITSALIAITVTQRANSCRHQWYLYFLHGMIHSLIQLSCSHERVKLFSMQRKIGDSHKDLYIKQIEKLEYHRSYYKILGKHHFSDVRHKAFESTPGDIITWSYYAEQFSFYPGGQIQNEFFDNNCSLSKEGCCLYCFIKQGNISSFYENGGGDVHQSNDKVREFYLHLSDSKLQNAATTTAHLHTLLAKVFEKKQMIRGGKMWYQTYGCANQYRCSIA